jgi:hypothetical protein
MAGFNKGRLHAKYQSFRLCGSEFLSFHYYTSIQGPSFDKFGKGPQGAKYYMQNIRTIALAVVKEKILQFSLYISLYHKTICPSGKVNLTPGVII